MNNKILVTLFTLFMFPVFQNLCASDSNTEISHNDIQLSVNDFYDKLKKINQNLGVHLHYCDSILFAM